MNMVEQIVMTYKARREIRTDAELAKRLGLRRSALANYKAGTRKLPDIAITELADGVGLPVEDVLAAANISLDKTSAEDRGYWVERMSHGPLATWLKPVRQNQGLSLVAPPRQRHQLTTSRATAPRRAVFLLCAGVPAWSCGRPRAELRRSSRCSAWPAPPSAHPQAPTPRTVRAHRRH